jgi:hypothetical protein
MNGGQSSTGQARHGARGPLCTYVALKEEEKASIRLYTWSSTYTLPLSYLARNPSRAAAYVKLLLLPLTQFIAVGY